jgi:hypothetical protein
MPLHCTEHRSRTGLRLLGGAAVAWLAVGLIASSKAQDQGFGRFSTKLVRCSVLTPGNARNLRNCGRLRIDQNVEGLLSVRFGLVGGAEDLVFAGMLKEGSSPMACSGDGRCTPRFPLELGVNALASSLMDSRGLALGLPRSHVVRGSCRIEVVRIRCEASGDGAERWLAEGFFLATALPALKEPR